MTQVIYGVPVGMVDKGRDVDRLISEWHRVFTLGGLIATLPWLVVPIINNRYLKPFLMPSKWHGHGTGHIMRVGRDPRTLQGVFCWIFHADYHLSRTRECSIIV